MIIFSSNILKLSGGKFKNIYETSQISQVIFTFKVQYLQKYFPPEPHPNRFLFYTHSVPQITLQNRDKFQKLSQTHSVHNKKINQL